MTDTKPTGKIVDLNDEKGGELFNEYIENKDPKSLLKAIKEFKKSSNPEKDKLVPYLQGLYKREKAIKETDNDKAINLLKEALKIFTQLKEDKLTIKDTKLRIVHREIRKFDDRKSQVDESLFLKSAKLEKELGRDKAHHQEMSLYYLFLLTRNMENWSSDELLEKAELMLKHAEKAEIEDQLHKTKGLYHQIRAKHLRSAKDSLKEWELALAEISKTSDKFGYDKAETEYLMSKAMSTNNKSEREKLLKEVAKRYGKQGDKIKEDFVLKLLSPVPIKASQVIYLAEKTNDKLRELEKRLVELKEEKRSPSSLFYHIGYMRERSEDVNRIIMRMAINRKRITDLHIKDRNLRPKIEKAGKPYPERLQKVLRQLDELRKQMRQDMESLFIYGNLLLDQWSYIIGYVAGYGVEDNYKMEASYYYKNLLKSFDKQSTMKELKHFWNEHKSEAETVPPEMNFQGLVNLLQSKKFSGELKPFWDKHKNQLIWLNYNLRYFRNVFVEHLRRPWQRGNTMGVYGEDFTLHIPSAVGYINEREEKKLLKEIYPLSPKKLRDMPDDYWEKKNLKRVLEVTMYYIDQVERQKDRDKVWFAWKTIGGSTQSYDELGLRLFKYTYDSLDTILEFVEKNKDLINYGAFKKP